MADLDSLFPSAASGGSARTSSGGSSSLDGLFPGGVTSTKAPVPVAPVSPDITAQATKIAQTVQAAPIPAAVNTTTPATPETKPSLFSKAGSLISGMAGSAGQFASDFFSSLPQASAQVSKGIFDNPITDAITNQKPVQDFAKNLFGAADNKAGTVEGFAANTGIQIINHLGQFGLHALSGVTGGAFKTPSDIVPTGEQASDSISSGVDTVLSTLGTGLGMAGAIGALGRTVGALGTPAGFVSYLNQYPTVAKYAIPLIQNAIGFAVYGQMDPELSNDLSKRAQTFATDMATAPLYTALGAIGDAKYSLPASFGLGFGMAKLNGANTQQAIAGGLAFSILDGAGRAGAPSYVDGRMTESALNSEAYSTLSKYSGHDITSKSTPEEIKSAWQAAAKATHPDLGGKQNDFISARSAYEVLTGKASNVKIFDESDQSHEAPTAPENQKAIAAIRSDASDALAGGQPREVVVKQVQDELGVSPEHATKIVDQAEVQSGAREITPLHEVGHDIQVAKAIEQAKATLEPVMPVDTAKKVPSTVEELMAPSTAKAPESVEKVSRETALAEEAKKYESADEFVKAQGEPVFHGTTNEAADSIEKGGFKLMDTQRGGRYTGDGLYFTPNKPGAENFAGKDGKILESYVKTHNFKTVYLPEDNIDWQPSSELVNEWKSKYDGVIIKSRDTDTSTGKVVDEWINEIVSFKPEQVKTKQQLKNIHAKVHAEPTKLVSRETNIQAELRVLQDKIDAGKTESLRKQPEMRNHSDSGDFGHLTDEEGSRYSNLNLELHRIERVKAIERLAAKKGPPATAEEAAKTYWDIKIQPAIDEQKAIVIGADDLKDFFGKDYNDLNHPIYSRASFLIYERALEESGSDRVVFTGGGPGSGKTESLVKTLTSEGYNGIIYDSNMANYDGVAKQIEMAHAAGKNIEVYGVIPNLDRARGFTITRENEVGRGISDKTFARGHAGFPRVALQLLENGVIKPEEIHLLDTRDVNDIKIAKNMVSSGMFASDPIAILKEVQYDEEHVKGTYSKVSYSKSGERLPEAASLEEPRVAPPKDGTNSTSEEAYAGETDLTSNVLEKLKGRSTVSKQFIENLIKTPYLRSTERAVIQKILDGESNTISVKDFADRVKTELLPLTVKDKSGNEDAEASLKAKGYTTEKDMDGSSYLTKDGEYIDYEDLPEDIQKDFDALVGGNEDYNNVMNYRYENVNLSDELRGNVATYKENIYESPIKTGAGDVHFKGETNNYFAHTRIEDTIDTTKDGSQLRGTEYHPGPRRVIELQSDLFQKGNLEKEYDQWAILKGDESRASIGEEEALRRMGARKPVVDRLAPYRNTWHERLVDEEVKAAAIDGKKALQFPTGETAMKIEGLGNSQTWSERGAEGVVFDLTPDDLSIGKVVTTGGAGYGNDWIITDVLGNGKFKAIPNEGNYRIGEDGELKEAAYDTNTEEEIDADIPESDKETFDISGEIDQSNPIYKFYESELAKYLKKQYGAKLVTDAQGVTWNEIAIDAAKAKDPIYAFGRSQEMQKPEPKPKTPKVKTHPEPMRGFINPGVIADDVVGAAKEIKAFVEKTQKSVELSDDLALNLYKLKGANQADLEQVAKLARQIDKVDATDNEALYHKIEETLNPSVKPSELTERQQELYDEYDQPLAQANKALTEKIKKAGYGIPAEGYIHRVPKGYRSAVDSVINPKETEDARLSIGGLLTKSSTSFKSRNMMALQDELGNRRVVSIKNAEYTIDKGVREGDVIRSKRVTGFDDGKKPVDLGSFKLKTNEQLLDSEVKPLQKKLKSIQKTIDGLDMLRIKEPLAKGRIETLENEVTAFAELIDSDFASGGYTAKDMQPMIRSMRARANELRVLKTVTPAERLTNQGDRIAKLQDDMRKISNHIAEVESQYDPETLDQKVFTDKSGKEWRIVQATTKEIEAQTNIEYHHNALASRIVQYLELNRIARAIDFIENFKNDPRFKDLAIEDTGQSQPEGYKRTQMPQFRTYWMENRAADVMDSFYNYTRPSEGLLEQGLEATGHFLTSAIFYNPIAHPLNVSALWLVDKGGTVINPTRYRSAMKAFAKAYTAVATKNDDYIHALLHGAPIMNTTTNKQDLANQLYETLASGIDTNPDSSNYLAKALSFKTVLDMKKAIGKAWHSAAWIPNDILTLQAIYQRMDEKGLSFEDAVQETARYIPDYRIPSRILGSAKISQTLTGRGVGGSVWFASAYHYGEMRSLMSMVKDIAAPKEGQSNREGNARRADAIGKALMLAFLAAILYPLLDDLWKRLTGNPNTYMSRSGSVKIASDVIDLAEGKDDYTRLLGAEMSFNPIYKGALELMTNRDFFTWNPIFGHPPAIGALAFAESIFAPAASGSRMSPTDMALSLLNVHTPKNSPGKSALQAQMYDEKPALDSIVKKEIAAGDDKTAMAQMVEFNQRMATNYQQALLQQGSPPATPAQVKIYINANGIKVPGVKAQADADKLYADNQVAGKQSLIQSVVNYAKAIGTDPATAFERIFTGQTILGVTNDKVIITARMPVAESEAIRQQQAKALGLSEDQLKAMQLDHVIPIAGGGSNDADNLSLVASEQNQVGQHPFELFLVKAVKSGNVSAAKAKEISIRYKAGLGENLSASYMDAYKNDYGSQPLTLQEVYDLVNSGKAK